MRIAAFYSDSPFAGWVQTEGFVDVLRRMGHDVVPVPVPTATQVTRERADAINKPLDDCDLVLVSGPEHLRHWIKYFYKEWEHLKVPKVGWYHESFVREDYSIDYKNFEGMFDFHFFPDKNDAEKYGGNYLPLGFDAAMCHDGSSVVPSCIVRDIPVAFIGLMYAKRARFVADLQKVTKDIPIEFRFAWNSERGLVPAISVYDFSGLNIRKSMELLSYTYRRIKVFVTFPSLSSVLVAKVLESLACGCTLVAPKQPVPLKSYYQYDTVEECAQAIRRALAQPISGIEEVHQHHRMENRFDTIFQKVGLCVSA